MDKQVQGVVLPKGCTGSSFFHQVLSEAVSTFDDVFAGIPWPDSARAFKSGYAAALEAFELARLPSARRVEVARFIAERTQEQLHFVGEAGTSPFSDFLRQPVEAPALETTAFDGAPGLPLEIPFDGQVYRDRSVLELADHLRAQYAITDPVRRALRWLVEHAEANGGRIDLRGQRFALMGAGAELAPTPLLQRAGAEVLWIDIADPKDRLAGRSDLAGRLHRAPSACDLLHRPREVAATIARFAEDGPVHVGMFAYAAGASQEWRLGASMNGIVRSLPKQAVASLALFISPTTVSHVYPGEVADAKTRTEAMPGWQRGLAGLRGLARPGQASRDLTHVARAVVSVQGASYQAAQYVSKLAAAEVYASQGVDLQNQSGEPLTVSANVAGITRTRSLSHPIFQAAFLGAPAFGVQIFDPDTTRALSAYLVLHDLLNPQAPGAAGLPGAPNERADRLFEQQVHGGVYSLPFALESAIRVAAILGMARKPSILMR